MASDGRVTGTILAAMAALVLLAMPGPGWAAAGGWGHTAEVEVRLVSAVDATGDGGTVPLGLEIRLKPGWKTYWRSPGDAGLAPQIAWTGSRNLADPVMAWPAPIRFSQFGLETFGYQDQVVLPITVRRPDRQQPLSAHAAVDLLVCHDICVPAHLEVTLELPLGAAAPAAEAALIARYAQRVPGDGTAAGLAITGVRNVGSEAAPVLEVQATAREPFLSPDILAETTPPQVFAAPTVHLDRAGHSLSARLTPVAPAGGGAPPALTGQPITLTLTDGDRALETTLAVAAAEPPPAATGTTPPPLATALAMALLGGFILNLMPCVLPVLSLKLLAVISHGGGCRRRVRAGFLASAAGILASFLLLATVMIALKAAGAAAGWGLQFQHPVFLAAMTMVMSLFACNLWDAFEIPLPRFIADAAAGPDHSGPLVRSFLTGALATALATPCSAPFLGTAIGFALAGGPVDILLVFLVMGLGLALPYLAVAAFPRVATALPRPGRWMVGLRRLLGLVMAATALWLLWLLAGQGWTMALVVGSLITGLAAVLALRPRLPARFRPAAVMAAAGLGLAAMIVPGLVAPPASAVAPGPETAAGSWRPFDPAALRAEVAAGHVVFVDITAAWCLTCQANQRLVLDRAEIVERLKHVIAMRGDWTRPDADIARYLASFGRYGIPFNAVYGPGAPAGLPLPELLDVPQLLEALNRAAAPGRGS